MRFHTIFLAIFITSFLNKTFGRDNSQIFGWPNPGDGVLKKKILVRAKYLKVLTHIERISMSHTVSAVKFWDKSKVGASISMSNLPPFRKSQVTFTSPRNRGINFVMEVFYSKRN